MAAPSSSSISPAVRAIINDRSWLATSMTDDQRFRYTLGVDLGTTFTGFGLADRANPKVIRSFDTWEGQPAGLFSTKTPTVSCYSRDNVKKLERWGWPAAADFSGRYHKLALIKLAMHPDTPAHRKPVIPEGLDCETIIADYLQALMGVVRANLAPDLRPDNTIVCFTVPVNWPPSAIQTMRAAAYRAGLVDDPASPQLKFAEEPEAAALTCLEESGVSPSSAGEVWLIADCGGGTVDLFQCTLGPDKRVDEITIGAGEFCGATFVDARFFHWLRNAIGDEAFEDLTLSPSLSATWRDLESRWDHMKRNYAGPDTTNLEETHSVIALSLSLYKAMSEEAKAKLRAAQDNCDDELRVSHADMLSFFDPILDTICNMVVNQLQSAKRPVSRLFFVGGFGANKYLIKKVTAAAQPYLLSPPVLLRNPTSAVLIGAVYFGLDASRIQTRRAKHTLALHVHIASGQQGVNQQSSNLIYANGTTYLVLVRRGDAVPHDAVIEHAHLALGERASTGAVKIYEMDDETQPKLIGRITITAPPTGATRRRVTLAIAFGSLDLRLRAVSEQTGQTWTARIDYNISEGQQVEPPQRAESLPPQSSGSSSQIAVLARSLDRLSVGSRSSVVSNGSFDDRDLIPPDAPAIHPLPTSGPSMVPKPPTSIPSTGFVYSQASSMSSYHMPMPMPHLPAPHPHTSSPTSPSFGANLAVPPSSNPCYHPPSQAPLGPHPGQSMYSYTPAVTLQAPPQRHGPGSLSVSPLPGITSNAGGSGFPVPPRRYSNIPAHASYMR